MLQIWTFGWGQQATFVAEVDLFEGANASQTPAELDCFGNHVTDKTGAGPDGSVSSDNDLFASTNMSTTMRVSVTETADQQLLSTYISPPLLPCELLISRRH